MVIWISYTLGFGHGVRTYTVNHRDRTMAEFKASLRQLDDASVLKALRGVLEQVAGELQPKKDVVTGAAGKPKAKKSKKSTEKRRSETTRLDHPLLEPLRSVLVRAARVEGVDQKAGIVKYLAGFVREHVWMLDVVLSTSGDGADGEAVAGACVPVFDAIGAQNDVDAAASFRRIHRLLCRDRGGSGKTGVTPAVDPSVAGLAVRAALEKADRLSVADVLVRQWSPWVLGVAALPLVDSRYSAVETERGVVRRVVELVLEASVGRPEVLVEGLSRAGKNGGVATGTADIGVQTSIETATALVELALQVVAGLSLRGASREEMGPSSVKEECGGPKAGASTGTGTGTGTDEERSSVAGLLTVRWELEWVARAMGVWADFRSFVSWDAPIRNRMLEFLLEDRDQSSAMADEFGRAVGLRCTPPQTLVALELLRASKASRDANDVVFAGHVGSFLRAGMEGLYRPTEVMLDARNQEFASLSQRIQVLVSKNGTMLTELGNRPVKLEECAVDAHNAPERDEKVDELLSLLPKSTRSKSRGTPRSASAAFASKRKIEPHRVGDVTVNAEDTGVDEKDGGNEGRAGETTVAAYEASIHQNGRVIMPPTYNLDSESRELLWKEYLKDKDNLVEMLGDASYRNWHDESRRPERRRQSGFDQAFDAIFGAGSAINDVEGTIVDEKGAFIETPDKKPLDLCWTFPWDALLVGALAVATDMVRQVHVPHASADQLGDDAGAEANTNGDHCGDTSRQHARLLAATVDAYEVRHYVDETLAALSEADRAAMAPCAADFDVSAGLGALICTTGSMRKILTHTAMHTRPELLAQYLELVQVTNDRCFKDLAARRKLRRPALLASTNLRACMSFPPLMGKAISSKSAKLLPQLSAMARDSESIIYTTACCWSVWHSLKSKRVPTEWLPEGVDLSTHPLCAAGVQQRCHFISSSLGLISAMVHEMGNGDGDRVGDRDGDRDAGDAPADIITALVASSSLCATAAADLQKGLILYRARAKRTKSAFQIVCEQKQVHLNLFSVASSLCEIYCGLADDWDEFLSLHTDAKPSEDSIPHAGAVVFGFDFTEAAQSYLAVLAENQEAVLGSTISTAVIESIRAMISETHRHLDRVLKRIQTLDKKSEVYTLSAQQIAAAPAVVVLDTVTHYTAAEPKTAKTANKETSPASNAGNGAANDVKRRKTIKDVGNSYVRAALMEADGDLGEDDYLLDDDLSDLEDFIVTKPDFDYEEFLLEHFPHGGYDSDD